MTTTETTAATQDRTLYGCPSWCTFDHAGPTEMDPGDHKRVLGAVPGEDHDEVALYVHPRMPTHVMVFLGRNGDEEYPATRETVEHLRDLALMLKRAADELAGMLHSGELEVQA